MFCQKCGNQLIEGSVFCSKCGQGISNIVSPTVSPVKEPLLPANAWKRLANNLLDSVGYIIFVFIIFFFIGFMSGVFGAEDFNTESIFFTLIIYIAMFVYFIFFESIWQRTPGKWATGTKVVRFDGDKPKFMQIVGRTFARIIPFEVFSFLGSSNPLGWHDRLPKTFVVPEKYTKEDVMSLNPEELKKKHSNIAIIIIVIFATIMFVGILASVVLASLNSAREKAKEAQQAQQIQLEQTQQLL